jgi:hypothetical protein
MDQSLSHGYFQWINPYHMVIFNGSILITWLFSMDQSLSHGYFVNWFGFGLVFGV